MYYYYFFALDSNTHGTLFRHIRVSRREGVSAVSAFFSENQATDSGQIFIPMRQFSYQQPSQPMEQKLQTDTGVFLICA